MTSVTPQTTSSSTSTSSSSTASTNAANFTTNYSDFLTLLTTQLQHQDPLSPMDSTQFTQQLVEFSGVEQQIQTNSNLNTLISLQQNSQTTTALSYVGKEVEVSGSTLPLVSGKAQFSYTLSSAAQTASVTITDQNGNVVRTMQNTPATATKNVVTWDGKDDYGNQLADGTYNFKVNAVDSSGNAVSSTSTFFGPVTGVSGLNSNSSSSSSNQVQLVVAGQNVPLSSVLSVSQVL